MKKTTYLGLAAASLALVVNPATVAAESKPKTVMAKDAHRAAKMEVEDPKTRICIRRLVPGSRVKARRICQTQTEWKAYLVSLEAMDRSWDESAKGVVIK